MINQTRALFCVVDDMLKGLRWQEDPRRRRTDSEVMATALAAALFFGNNQDKARAALHQSGLIPRPAR